MFGDFLGAAKETAIDAGTNVGSKMLGTLGLIAGIALMATGLGPITAVAGAVIAGGSLWKGFSGDSATDAATKGISSLLTDATTADWEKPRDYTSKEKSVQKSIDGDVAAEAADIAKEMKNAEQRSSSEGVNNSAEVSTSQSMSR